MTPIDSEIIERARELLLQGYSAREICRSQLKGLICEQTLRKYVTGDEREVGARAKKDRQRHAAVEEYKQCGKLKYVSTKYGISPNTLRSLLHAENIDTRKIQYDNAFGVRHQVNDRYFEHIDSLEKAYYLGLFYADGVVYMREHPPAYMARISLTEADSYILENLNRDTNQGRAMHTHAYKKPGRSPAVIWTVSRKKMCLDLQSHGCGTRKSMTLKFPTSDVVSERYLPAFLRGYLDGDGCVGIYGGNLSVSLATSDEFADGFVEFYQKHFKATCCIFRKPNHTNISLNNIAAKIRFYEYIYQDRELSICLKRKKAKFDEYIDFLNEKSGSVVHSKINLSC